MNTNLNCKRKERKDHDPWNGGFQPKLITYGWMVLK
jgi:hypothetical protein